MLKTGKTCITIDETNLEHTNGEYMGYFAKGENATVPKLNVWPRITIILALSTNGEMYISIAQSNNNA